MLSRLTLYLREVISALLVAGVWQLVWVLGIVPEKYFPPIGAVAASGWSMLASGDLIAGDAATFSRALIGLAGAALFGVLLAILSDLSPFFRNGFRTISDLAQPIPPAALVPMAVFALGLGWKLYAFIIVLVTVWPTYLNGLAALRGVSDVQLRTAQMLGLGRLQQLWHIKLPAALPEILVGLRYAATLSLIAVIVAEMLAGRDGVGFMIYKKAFALRTPEVFALMFVIAFNGVVLNAIVDVLRWSTTRWHLRMMERQE